MAAERTLRKRIGSILGFGGEAEATAVDGSSPAESLLEQGRLPEALAASDKELAKRPDNSRAMFVRGRIVAAQGNVAEGSTLVARAIAMGEDSAEAHASLGRMLASLGRLKEAEHALGVADAMEPDDADVTGALGFVRLHQGNTAGALDTFERGVARHPANAELLNNLGGVCKDTGRLDEAIAHFRAALEVQPRNVQIWLNLATAQMAARQWREAAENFRNILLLDDRLADAWAGLGSALAQTGDWLDAEQACREAIALRPDWARGHLALASALGSSGKLDEAEESTQRALRLDPKDPDLWVHQAALHYLRKGYDAADRCYRHALELGGSSAKLRYDYGLFLLSTGDYLRGFELMEARFDALPGWYTRSVRLVGNSREPWRWRGENLKDRSILVIGEQGFGDHLMMFRFLAELESRGAARVAVACTRPLVRMAATVDGVDEVIEVASDDRVAELVNRHEFDLYCPLMSLAHALRVSRDRLDGRPYLSPSREPRAGRPSGPLRVGLVWAGNSTRDDPLRRGFSLQDLSPLRYVAGVAFVCLQKDVPEEQRIPAEWSGLMVDEMASCADFLDTSRIVASLDVVISVDTAVAHLAAGMGVPTWLLLKAGGEWRWGNDGSTSPWYRAIRIFRQEPDEDWTPIVTRVRDALADLAASAAGVPSQPSIHAG